MAQLLYAELRHVAARLMERERIDHTLAPTALVHEAWLRLVGDDGGPGPWENRLHFLRAAARAMRRVLIDNARRRGATHRVEGREREPLDEALAFYDERGLDLLALDEALEQLAEVDPGLARLVELRFFTGLTNAQVGEALGISLRSAERGWHTARAFLETALGEVDAPAGESGADAP
jgi:RNA polymerase sigma factor (TIGR02999 family)